MSIQVQRLNLKRIVFKDKQVLSYHYRILTDLANKCLALLLVYSCNIEI